MAKKKRRSGKRQADRGGASPLHLVRSRSPEPNVAERTLFDIGRLVEGEQFDSIEHANEFLEKVFEAGVPRLEGDVSPLQRAQSKMYDAWEADGERRIELAKEALEISADCADAYVLIADESDTAEAALELLEKAVEAGARALGSEYFELYAGQFWRLLDTRPYMRALAAKAYCQADLGERQEAIACYRELLRLDPEDHQYSRYMLTKLLLLEGEVAEAGAFLKRYRESSAIWAYTYALWAFRTYGESEEALQALMGAFNENAYVPMVVGGVIELPEELPDYYEHGSEEEAVVCTGEFFEPWIETPGSLQWILGIASAIMDEVMTEESRRSKRKKAKRRKKTSRK
jgi:tetratricopeptide (TPR) repeat protein